MPTRTEIRTATRVRREFIDFFVERHGHAFVPSSPVVPRNDPTLLFANAGMNQFKDVFLGQGRRDYARAVNSQKCIRAGGKHNDLEDVGRDHYHHTFFEMLGNWSFGDYFKEEAIEWAWALLTEVWGLEAERLQITVFAGDEADGLPADEEAASIWRKYVPEDRISRWGRKDNFWEMGGTGPCGPCSEIHYDFTPDRSGAPLVNLDDPRVVELWNLVFIQFNRGEEGGLTPLPARHVDTGMGLERLTRVLQHKESNYDTDLWTPVFAAIEAHTGAHPYRGRLEDPVDVAYRVVADHVRCLTVALADGAVPGNEGRGYVLRRILRRAVRHAHQTLGVEGPVLCDLTRAVVDSLGDAFPDLGRHLEHVTALIRDEERSFLRTLDRGLALFDEAVEQCRAAGSSRISAESAFRLHDTFGFPFDLTRVMARERGLDVDEAGYEARMTEARAISRRGGDERRSIDLPADAIARLRYKGVEPTVDVEKHDGRPITAHVKAVWNGTDFDEDALDFGKSDLVGLVTDRTNFYAEQGGQVGDTGVVRDVDGDRSELQVVDTRVYDGYVLHVGRLVRGRISVGESLELVVDRSRRGCIRANHTATHLLNHALREVLGDDVDQKGSLVAADRLRFDFSFSHAMDDEQLRATEALVNEWIAADLPVHAEEVPLDVARALHGVRAVFGEHYPDPVRVVSIGTPVSDLVAAPDDPRWRGTSIEFCGGTHLARTKEAER
ncbi:MAG: alanine--tRNA ligase, partial [Planctomycetota bacterium]